MDNRHGKNKRLSFLFLLALPFLALSIGTTADAATFRLIYANDNLGELDGCG
jgi:hypothetical protein